MAFSLTKGKRYHVSVGLEGYRTQYQYRNVIYRGKIKYKGLPYYVFEDEFVHMMIDVVDLREVQEVKQRYEL